MKKKLIILTSILIVALLAFTLSACSVDLNQKATITINITRTAVAKDCEIEVTSSYGTVTRNGDTVTVEINVYKDFVVTLSSSKLATETVNVTINSIKKGKATFNVTFGNSIPTKHEIAINENYTNFMAQSSIETLTIESKDNLLILNNADKYSNPTITITADGYESMTVQYSDIITLPIVMLVKSGKAQIIYMASEYRVPNLTLQDSKHNIYSPIIIGGNAYFDVPLLDTTYRTIGNYNFNYTIAKDKAYGNIIKMKEQPHEGSKTFLTDEMYEHLQNYYYSSYQVDIDGNIIASISYSTYGNGHKNYFYLLPECHSLLFFDAYSFNNYRGYISVLKSEFETTDFNNLELQNLNIYTKLNNTFDNTFIDSFNILEYAGEDSEGGAIYNKTPSIDGRIQLTSNGFNQQYEFSYNGDIYTYSAEQENIVPNGEQDHFSTFINGELTYVTLVCPTINIQFSVYDGERLLKGEGDNLFDLTYQDGYYLAKNWDQINSDGKIEIQYSNLSNYSRTSSSYIDIKKLERVGEKTYRYNNDVYINNNYFFNIRFTLDGAPLSEYTNFNPTRINNAIVNMHSGNVFVVETALNTLKFYITLNDITYSVTLNINDHPSDGTEFIYNLSSEE